MSDKSEQLKWCNQHIGSLWKIYCIEDNFERAHDFGLLVKISPEEFCIISSSGNRWKDPEKSENIFKMLNKGTKLGRSYYRYEFVQNKVDYNKLLTPAYQVLFTEGDKDDVE